MLDIKPSKNELKDLIKNSDKKYVVPLYYEIIADLETPVSAFYKVCKDKKYSFLLESVEGGENFGRYSYIGIDPLYILKSDSSDASIYNPANNEIINRSDNPFDLLQKFLFEYSSVNFNSPYSPGAFGYISYDSVRHIEPVLNNTFKKIEGCDSFPEAYLMIAGSILTFDHVKHKIFIINSVLVDSSSDIEKIYADSADKIKAILEKMQTSNNAQPLNLKPAQVNSNISSNLSKEEWINAVNTAKEHILAGDIFQVVLSQRFCVERNNMDTFTIYRSLRSINPSPYLYYLNFNDFQIIGSSPEILVKCNTDKVASLRPIAGTRRRGIDTEEDQALRDELLQDPKEVAEHVMLVDLGRNDLGRVCEYGSVKVKRFMDVEKYSHVQHIVTDITGKLQDNIDSIDLVKACFPAGTVSGAPKIRAMEIIYDLEKAARGPYAGCVGYFGFNNEINTAITIRTMLVRDNKLFIQAGAGIVADSDPETEYIETQNKAAALVQAINNVVLN
ncbi:MAG: anthranilate synthase component I [Candidatus Gastranaerophilales bacterium]|nr:anthranilate synthase component I [Candidatus Gastranaerophilales bacterium]